MLKDQTNFEYIDQQESMGYNINEYIDQSKHSLQDCILINKTSLFEINDSFRKKLNANKMSYLTEYLNFLINYPKKKEDDQVVKEAMKCLFSYIDFNKVCEDIQKEIITNYRIDTKYHNMDVTQYINQLTQSRPEVQERIAQCFSRLTQKQIRAIVQGTKSIINKINEELECFCLRVSTTGQYFIFLIAQTYTNALASNLEIIFQSQPLMKFEQRKQPEKLSFIAKLTKNKKEMDISLGKKLANDSIQFIYEKAKLFSITAFQDNMNQQKPNFTVLNTFKDLENQILEIANKRQNKQSYQQSNDDQQLIIDACVFFKDPKQYLENKFEQKFGEIIKKFVKQSLNEFYLKYKESLKELLNYLDLFMNSLQIRNSIGYSVNMFVVENESQNEENHQYLKKAAVRYVCEVVKKTWDKAKIIEINQKSIVRHPKYTLPINYDLKDAKLDDKFRIFFSLLFDQDEEIHNIYNFLSEFKNNIKIKLTQLDQAQIGIDASNVQKEITEQDLIGDFMIQFKLQFMGCREHCPLCRRQCDQQHKDDLIQDILQHECASGHQLQAFGGSYSQFNYKAIIISCNQLQNNDIINFKGNDIKWVVFKEQPILQNWIFDVDEKQQNIYQEKNMKIWNVIGPYICQMYQRDGIPIVFQEATILKPQIIQVTHFILMLDSSGSMSGIKWQQLLECVSNFLNQLESNSQIRENVKVSIIRYNQTSDIVVFKESPTLDLIQRIPFKGGGTDFGKPMLDAYNLCQQSHKEFDKIVLFFMSDGEAPYPQAQVTQLANFQKDKIEFQGVGFGNKNFKVLEQISQAFLKGKMTKTPTFEALKDSFDKIVSVVYGSQN